VGRWWESERSKTAVAVRRVRKRLRANYVIAAANAREGAERRMRWELEQERARYLAEIERLGEAVNKLARVQIYHERHQLSTSLRGVVSFSDEFVLVTKNDRSVRQTAYRALFGLLLRKLADGSSDEFMEARTRPVLRFPVEAAHARLDESGPGTSLSSVLTQGASGAPR
jgi:hypothetical protein